MVKSAFALILMPLSAPAWAQSSQVIHIPPGMKVTAIVAHQDRSENANVEIAVRRPGGRWMVDGSTGPIEHGKTVHYSIHYPQLFSPSARGYLLRVGGTWNNSSTNLGFAKSDAAEHPDGADVALYTGLSEPPNTTVHVAFQR